MKKLSDLVVYETTDAFRSLIISNDFKYHVGHAYINFSPFTTPKSETIAESLLRLVPETYMTIEDITKSCKMKKICRERVSELSNTAISHAVSSLQERAYHNTVRHIDTCVPAPLALSDRTELRSVLSLLVTLVVMATIGYFLGQMLYPDTIAHRLGFALAGLIVGLVVDGVLFVSMHSQMVEKGRRADSKKLIDADGKKRH